MNLEFEALYKTYREKKTDPGIYPMLSKIDIFLMRISSILLH